MLYGTCTCLFAAQSWEQTVNQSLPGLSKEPDEYRGAVE